MKPRIFLGSSGKQQKLLDALTRGLDDIADVRPWTTVFDPGVSTLDRLVELTKEVDFAAMIFAQDDWTSKGASTEAAPGEASPRDNVVFEAGLFGGALGMRGTFILHARGCQTPDRPTRSDRDPLRPRHDARDRPPEQPPAPPRDRRRGTDQPARGRLVAALAHREDVVRAVCGVAADDQA